MSGRRRLREHVKGTSNPFSTHIRKIAKALESDDDEHITYIEAFLKAFPPSTSRGFIEENSDLIKRLNLLDLVLDKILPATFADSFLSMIHMLIQIDDFDIEIYSSDGISKIIYSMKENMENHIHIIGSKIISYLALNEALRDALGDECDVIEHLIDSINHLGKSSEDVCIHILHALINITYDNEQNKCMVSKFGSQILIDLASSYYENYNILNKFMELFRNLANSEDGKYTLAQSNIIDIILHVFNNISLSNETTRLYTNTFWTFINMNCGNNQNMITSIENGFIPILLSYLSNDVDQIYSSLASLALFQLSRLSKARSDIIDNDGVIKVIELIKTLDNVESLDYPCKLLERLCINGKARQIIINDDNSSQNIISLLMKMNQFGDVSFHHSIVKFLYRLIQDKDENISSTVIKILKENQGISVLVTSMNSHQQASQLKSRICDILNSLFANDKSNSDDNNTDTSSDECSEGSDRMNEDYDSIEESRIDNENDDKTSQTQYESFYELDHLENYYDNDAKSLESEENFNLSDIENIDIENSSIEYKEEFISKIESDPTTHTEDENYACAENQENNTTEESEPSSKEQEIEQIPTNESTSKESCEKQEDISEQKNSEAISEPNRKEETSEYDKVAQNEHQSIQNNQSTSFVNEVNREHSNKKVTKVKELVQKWASVSSSDDNQHSKNPKVELEEEIEQKRVKNAFSFWLEKDKTSRKRKDV